MSEPVILWIRTGSTGGRFRIQNDGSLLDLLRSEGSSGIYFLSESGDAKKIELAMSWIVHRMYA